MSIQAISWVLDHSESEGFARLVMIVLANHYSSGTSRCNPGHRAIAEEARISRSAVTAQIRKLVELGEIEVVDNGTSHQSAEYRLTKYVQQVDVLSKVRPDYVQQVDVVGEVRPDSDPTTSTIRGQNQDINQRSITYESAQAPRKRGTRIPDPFDVTEEMVRWVTTKYHRLDWEDETDKFCDYWEAKPGAGAVKLDWVATWRNWMRNAAKYVNLRDYNPKRHSG